MILEGLHHLFRFFIHDSFMCNFHPVLGKRGTCQKKVHSSIKLESCKMFRIATHSKTDPCEIIKKLRLSGIKTKSWGGIR